MLGLEPGDATPNPEVSSPRKPRPRPISTPPKPSNLTPLCKHSVIAMSTSTVLSAALLAVVVAALPVIGCGSSVAAAR